MGIIVFNGKSSKDYRILVEHPPGYEMPERDYEKIHVPGRNGDVIINKGSYKNTNRSYEIAFGDLEESFFRQAMRVSEWLHSGQGYSRLEDSYEPEYYRLASYDEDLDIDNILFHAGRAKITFNCKPQRFLKIGEKTIIFSENGILKNPTVYQSLPTIIVNGTGAGVVNVGNYQITISDVGQSVTINSELQDAYNGLTNRNGTITLSSGFPKLESGDNSISFSGGVTSLEVMPKWWIL